MADPRTRAVKQALQTSEEIRRLFGRIGTRQYPRGLVLAAYRTALAAMRGSTDNNRLMDDALGTLRLAVIDAVMDVLNRGVDIGMHQAETELKLWGISAFGTAGNVDDAARIVSNILDNQIQAAWTMKRMGVEEAVLLGDAAHLGIINPTVITRETARWASMTVNDAYGSIVKQSLEKSGDAGQFDKQAVAAIDDKTTDCCLKVHGQIVPLDGKFKLTGEPRFADEMDRPGFHWWCRSATVLVLANKAKDQLTLEMEAAASNEIKAREETGKREEIHPSHARSGRNQ